MINSDGSLPKISCLMVTANGRLEMFKRSFDCYKNQSYSNRELLIVNEGTSEYQNKISEIVSDRKDVRLIFLNGNYTLGSLRNISIRLAHGDIFCQWDDDDLNTSERLSLQANFLLRHPKAKHCYLSDQLHFYFDTNSLYWESWGSYHSGGIKKYSLIPGTIMSYCRSFNHLYPSSGDHCRSGEDTVLAYELCKNEEEVVLLSNAGHSMVYSYHGKNVWSLEHHMNLSKQRSLPVSNLLENRDQITKTIRDLKLGQVRVIGREGLAFVVND